MKQSPLSFALYVSALFIVLIGLSSLFTGIGLSAINIESSQFFFGHGDWLFHFALFHLSSWLVYTLDSGKRRFVWCLLIALGIGSELAQTYWVQGRDGSMSDATVNVLAVLSVFPLRFLLSSRRQHHQTSK
ncbi:hypothetical protein A1OQ_23310 [Enterovibrio norvegicus FF-162]|uniref:hypothetical protein n=1 Tax=Enterovibrio norvegicus TaxID=188144 RepID=UPI000306F9E3|nr:hypothetical protein [Enterovibrio norvegicus]OEE75031.1 hypothetical protein A1OQ_23310 [Enterovibrio norvegicus FF-162]